MLSNASFLAKFRFGTAENEPATNLQNFAKNANFAIAPGGRRREGGARGRAPYVGVVAHLEGAEVRGRPAVPLGGGRAVPRLEVRHLDAL